MPTHALLLQLARHLLCYLQLGATAAVEYRSAWVRRIVLLLVGVATAIAGLVAAWIAGLVAVWDTPWRLFYVAASALLLLVVAAVSFYRALSPPAAGPAARIFRAELRKDMELFQEWKSTI
jgi:hypothetical protein